jgi:hypothetical protein
VSDQLHAPATLSPGKESLIPVEWEGGLTTKPVLTFGELINVLCVPGSEPRLFGRSALSLVTISPELTRLRYELRLQRFNRPIHRQIVGAVLRVTSYSLGYICTC